MSPYLVRKIKAPALLLWVPINYHLLDDGGDGLGQALAWQIPGEILAANVEARGVLLAPDGGEPRRSWATEATYEHLERELSPIGRWIQVQADDLPQPSASALDDLLLELDPAAMVQISGAIGGDDLVRARALLRQALGARFESVRTELDAWIARRRHRTLRPGALGKR